jgi:hypothetical protein
LIWRNRKKISQIKTNYQRLLLLTVLPLILCQKGVDDDCIILLTAFILPGNNNKHLADHCMEPAFRDFLRALLQPSTAVAAAGVEGLF